jgi:hypothetical protein
LQADLSVIIILKKPPIIFHHQPGNTHAKIYHRTRNPRRRFIVDSGSARHITKIMRSAVTNDKVYCVYIAPDEATVRAHAEQGGFPANRVSEIKSIIDPTTAEG